MSKQAKFTQSAVWGACLLATLVVTAPASAQWNGYAFGSAQRDTRETMMLFAGFVVSPGSGPRWVPTFGLQGYYVTYKATPENINVTGFKPSIGLKHGFTGGSYGFSGGYAFVNRDGGAAPPAGVVVEDTDDGFVLAGNVEYWGTGGPIASQTLASYNFGSSGFWGRQRVTARVFGTEAGSFRFGGEVAYMKGNGYQATQPGLVASWATPGFTFGAGVGRTLNSDADDETYYKVEVGFPLFR